jgi:hypothetical protein
METKDTSATQYRTVRILTKGSNSSGKKPDVVPRCGELQFESNEQIEWVTVPPNVGFTVTFIKETGSPFADEVFTSANNISGPPKDPGEKDKFYAYSLEVDGHATIDPGVIIWK